MSLLIRWAAAAIAVAAAAQLVPGIAIEGGIVPLFIVALLLGLVNAAVRPVLRFLSCGLIFLTLGLFLLVINAVMLLLAAWLARAVGIGFYVDGFVPALLGSIVISLVSLLISLLFPERDRDD